MTDEKKTPVKASTQEFIEVEDVVDDIVLLKDHSCSLIIRVGTTNYPLLPPEEQEGLVSAFAAMLNSLSFPVQINIISKAVDVTLYIAFLDKKMKEPGITQLMHEQLVDYRQFILSLVKKDSVMEKTFYMIVPFSPMEIGVSSTGKSNKEYIVSHAKTILYPKRDHILRLLNKMGLGGRVLLEDEVVSLFYNLYNPAPQEKRLAPLKSYTETIKSS